MEETIAAIVVGLIAWLIYLLPAVLLCLPIWYLGRQRAQFMWWESSVFVLPFTIWLVLFNLSKDKTLANLVEALILGCLTSIVALIRVLAGRKMNRVLIAASLIALQCVFAIVLAAIFPGLPFHWFH